MASAVARLTDFVEAENCYTTPWSELLHLQMEAASQCLAERRPAIRLLAKRAETSGIGAIREPADIVPLLFAHTSYKSYPESWFTQGKWDRMCHWLDTLTTAGVRDIDTRDVKDVDDWIDRLSASGHYLSCSSGTTGKCSILPASSADRCFVRRQMVQGFSWATGIAPKQDYKVFGLAPATKAFRHHDSRQAIVDAFACADRQFPTDPITVGQVTRMVALRRSIADGTARPADIAAFEATSTARGNAIEEGLRSTAEAIVSSRREKLMVQGLVPTMFRISEMVREMGYGAKDFHPENALMTGGGLKGVQLPPDYRERIFDTFNVRPERTFQFYSMQEINTTMPRCKANRYHVAPWLMLLILDETGDRLMQSSAGETEGRAGFLDLSLDGRWCGVITGDKVRAHYGKCPCGHEGPTIANEIVRYADLPGGDKINCAGTIDAYIRGAT
jgi:hypothetical protein